MSTNTLSAVFEWGRALLSDFSRRSRKPEPALSPRAGELQKILADIDRNLKDNEADLASERRNEADLRARYDKEGNRDKLARLDSELRVSGTIIQRSQTQLQERQTRRAKFASELSTIQAQHAAAVADYELSTAIDNAKDEMAEIDEGIKKALIRRREICVEFNYTRGNATGDLEIRKRCQDFADQAAVLFEISVLSGTIGKIRNTSGIGAGFRHYFVIQSLEPRV
jgi:DNA repair exonuclease SbcCD ATPase subunit